MTTIPLIGQLLVGPGWVAALASAVVTPGVHVLLSATVERRPVNLTNDYPAVLIGDPLLAVACGIGVHLADGRLIVLADWRLGLLSMASGAAFGWWQVRAEVAAGRYSPEQAASISKRFHQYVVYPILGYLVPTAVLSGLAAWQPLSGTIMIGCVVIWAALVVEAFKNPRVGHGERPPWFVPTARRIPADSGGCENPSGPGPA